MIPGVTFGITTRNRPEALRQCIESIRATCPDAPEILVFDDASAARVTWDDAAVPRVRIFRSDTPSGPTRGRNRLVEEARTALVMLLDDDARLLTRESLASALEVLAHDRMVAAVAFAQAEADGSPWPASMQPAPGSSPARVRAFIGFAHMIRRDVFRALSGYRTALGFYGEEKEFCLRLLDAGYCVVYLPAARVAHVPDPAGRDARRYLRAVTRNDCLNALFNEPWWRAAWLLPARGVLYFRMRRHWNVRDTWGPWWLLREFWRALPVVWRERRPVRAATRRRWTELGIDGEPYRS